MAFKRIINSKSFWRSVAGMGIIFAIVYQLISMLFEYGGFHFSAFYEDKLSGDKWIRFAIGTLLAAFLYGFIVSYGQFRSRFKKEEKEKENR